MTTEQSLSGKRQRFDNPTTEPTTSTPSSDLYEPGDIVWSKLGSFPWWPALIVC
jgi:hypothetical protein